MRRSYSAFLTALLLTAALVVPLLFGSVPVRAQSPAAGSDDILIQGGTVLTITNGTRQDTDVLVRDGVIAEITDNNRNRVFKATQIMDIVERPARDLPDPNDLVDIETAWRLPDRPNSE